MLMLKTVVCSRIPGMRGTFTVLSGLFNNFHNAKTFYIFVKQNHFPVYLCDLTTEFKSSVSILCIFKHSSLLTWWNRTFPSNINSAKCERRLWDNESWKFVHVVFKNLIRDWCIPHSKRCTRTQLQIISPFTYFPMTLAVRIAL